MHNAADLVAGVDIDEARPVSPAREPARTLRWRPGHLFRHPPCPRSCIEEIEAGPRRVDAAGVDTCAYAVSPMDLFAARRRNAVLKSWDPKQKTPPSIDSTGFLPTAY